MLRLVLLIFFFLSANVFAKQEFDTVRLLKLNNINIVNSIKPSQLDKIFGNKGIYGSAEFSECTANYDLSVVYKEKEARLEFFPEDNSKFELTRIFSKPSLSSNDKKTLNASLWVSWDNMGQFTEVLKMDNYIIKPELTYKEFKTQFPISAKQSQGDGEYHVLFGNNGLNPDPPPYSSSVGFIFKNGKLNKLFINQGVAC